MNKPDKSDWSKLGIMPGTFLLPKNMDISKWAVIACDQYTQNETYWKKFEAHVASSPSTLKMILPEVYLNETEKRVPKINATMENYVNNGILQNAVEDGFILVERITESGSRLGLVCVCDLEQYDYSQKSNSNIRPSEKTVTERIPPRLAIRKNASLELSHVLLLVNDALCSILEPLSAKRNEFTKLYDTSLFADGGQISAYAITDEASLSQIFTALTALKAQNGDFLFAVGDGNHSLATAKAHWEALKPTLTAQEAQTHPARFAMVEVENLHGESLIFEPVHRVLYGADGDDLLSKIGTMMSTDVDTNTSDDIIMVYEGKEVVIPYSKSDELITVGVLQNALDKFLETHPECSIDYIHGEAEVRKLAQNPNTVAFVLPAMDKNELFPEIQRNGSLPRKTFSMGEANEKRYYIECRKIK